MSIQFARRGACRAVQHGQALLVMLTMLVISAIAVFYTLFSPASLTLDQDKITAAVLAEAKAALIGRAASDANRPGSLPCPDFDDGTANPINAANDGVADVMVGNSCPSYLGRLPWRTLGLPDLRDGTGERLWYALSNRFHDHPSAEPINSDTPGNRTVHLNSIATVLTDEAVAVIFAPGPVVAGQIRDAANANNPANYLDTAGGVNNATATGPFISTQMSPTFNDRLLVITTADLIPVVEQRVARELIQALTNYQTATAAIDPGTGEAYCKRWTGEAGCYPWADGDQNGCSDAPPYETATAGAHRGRIPTTGAAPYHWGAPAPTCASREEFLPLPSPPPGMPELPAWVINNQWTRVIYYTAGRRFLGPGACHTCQNPSNPAQLRMDEVEKEVVLITPGPAGISGAHTDFPHDYLENPENKDATDDYVTPKSTAHTRDRIFTIP